VRIAFGLMYLVCKRHEQFSFLEDHAAAEQALAAGIESWRMLLDPSALAKREALVRGLSVTFRKFPVARAARQQPARGLRLRWLRMCSFDI